MDPSGRHQRTVICWITNEGNAAGIRRHPEVPEAFSSRYERMTGLHRLHTETALQSATGPCSGNCWIQYIFVCWIPLICIPDILGLVTRMAAAQTHLKTTAWPTRPASLKTLTWAWMSPRDSLSVQSLEEVNPRKGVTKSSTPQRHGFPSVNPTSL